MKNKLQKIRLSLMLLLALGLCQFSFGQFKVVGYAASWAPTTIQYSKLTHINYSFALPQYGGRLKPIDNPGYLQTIVANAHANGVKVYIAIGGWSDHGAPLDPVFESIGADPGSRANLINDALYLINTYNLDGVDMDWEYPDAGASSNNFLTLMREFSNALKPRGKGLSFAGPADNWSSSGIPSGVFQYVDHVNIMAYDNGSGHHSTYQFAVDGLNLYKGKGCPAHKCVVGVPFYARPSWRSYAQLLAAGANPNSDWFGSDGYNGINTIKQKTQMALNNAGGIMIWELSQDAQGANSLLTAINSVVKSSNNNNNSGVATFYKHCNYDGYAIKLPVGNYNLSDLIARGILNDDVSSIQVNSGYEVQLFWDHNFSGSSIVISGNNSCLGSWNDKASSIRVRTKTSTSGTTIQAENYNIMSGVQTEGTSDAGGGSNVGWIDAGDWMAYYNVNFPTSGTYIVQYRVASQNGGGRLSCDLNGGSIQLGAINVPSTGGWQNWTTITQTINVNAGTYNFGIYAQAGGWNLNWFKISKQGSAAKMGSAAISDDDVYDVQAAKLDVYPNPVINELNLKFASDLSGEQVKIVDATGIVVLTATAGNAIDVSSLGSGIYTVVISSNGKLVTKRFVKN